MRHPTVLTAPVLLPAGPPDVPLPAEAVPAGVDLVRERPSATLLAARQLSDEADLDPHRSRGFGPSAANRRRRSQRALLAERRADRSRTAGG
jgi:hypothetical protein